MSKRLEQDIEKKRKLEIEATKIFGIWYALVLKDIVAKNLTAINSSVKNDLTKRLERVWRKVAVTIIPEEMANSTQPDMVELRNSIYSQVQTVSDKRIPVNVGYIIESTEKQIKNAVKRAETIKDEDGKPPVGRALIIATMQILAIQFQSKAKTDAITQVNVVSEMTKFTLATTETSTLIDYAKKVDKGIDAVDRREITPEEYAAVLIGAIAIRSTAKKFSKDVVKAGKAGRAATVHASEVSPVGANIFTTTAVVNQKKIRTAIKKFLSAFKRWVNMEDSHVRPTHTGATMQGKVEIHAPFSVGAYYMMYPGDYSLGAGVEEIINCRCGVDYI